MSISYVIYNDYYRIYILTLNDVALVSVNSYSFIFLYSAYFFILAYETRLEHMQYYNTIEIKAHIIIYAIRQRIMADKKVAILAAIGLAVTFLVYIGLQNSLRVPSLSSTPISSETAVVIVAKKQNLTLYNLNDFYTRYVYIKGDGTIFESDSSSNSIGKYLGKTKPTITMGNHFAWMVKENSHVYFVDSVTGETIT